MSAPVLPTALNRDSDEAKQRIAHNCALAEALRARVAEAALGGNAKSRENCTFSQSPVLANESLVLEEIILYNKPLFVF